MQFKNLINQTKLSFTDENNTSYYNTCTSTVQKTFCYASKMSNAVYKSKYTTPNKNNN